MSEQRKVSALGEILLWPGGYAMSLGRPQDGMGSVLRCCSGHKSPEDAKNHGLVRLIEVASQQADQHIAEWAAS